MAEKKPQDSLFMSGEFFSPPTSEMVMEFLKRQGGIGKVLLADYADYVLPLGQLRNISQSKEKPEYRMVWNLYFSVAGRIRMFNDDMALRELVGVIEPDPRCEPAGWVYQDETRLVYRVRVAVYQDGVSLGERYGTSWVPWVGGTGAVSSNRFEKVETSATGRALAQWGYGVLPGSGVASFEEMLSIAENVEQPKAKAPKRSRKDMQEDLQIALETLAKLKNQEPQELMRKILAYAAKTFKVDSLDRLKDGEILLLLSKLKQEISAAEPQEEAVQETLVEEE